MNNITIDVVIFEKPFIVTINPEFLAIKNFDERSLLGAVADLLNEIDIDEYFMHYKANEYADRLSSIVRNSYSSYCVNQVPCFCGGEDDWCSACFGVGEYGDIDEGPALVVLERPKPNLYLL